MSRSGRNALITGAGGQDGFFLAKMLLQRGDYDVYALLRRNSSAGIGHLSRLDARLRKRLTLLHGDVTDAGFMHSLIARHQFDEIYHLAAMSHVGHSFSMPDYTFRVNTMGTLNVLNAVREVSPLSRVYFAGTSEQFGKPQSAPQNESTPFNPRSPYAASKVAAFHLVKLYREAYGLFACSGIAFNHESEIRGPEFVTRKIAIAVASAALGEHTVLRLGNLDAVKDWGYAPEYVRAMWLMLQAEEPHDYVIGTGESHTVREFASEAVKCAFGECPEWDGSGEEEHAIVRGQGVLEIRVDPALFRPLEADNYRADASRIHRDLGWKADTLFPGLVDLMVRSEMEELRRIQSPHINTV